MHNELLIAILAGLGGMFGWGLADFFAKKTIDEIGAIKSLVWAHSFGATLFILITLGQVFVRNQSVDTPATVSAWAGLVFFGALQMIVYWLVYEGFNKGQLAVLNPVFASYSGLVALISIIFFGENLGVALGIGLVALFFGIVLMNLDIKGLKSKQLNIVPGLKEVGAAAILAAVWTVGWDRFIDGKDALSYAMFMYIFMTAAAFVLAAIMKVTLRGISPGLKKFLVLIGISEVLAYLAISWGFSETSLTSIVALVSGSFSLPTIVLAFIFLKERISQLQVAAIAVIIAGIALVSIG
ncbi:MAG: protein of unknown function transrane [Candidatus Saccharibacteria bacterium]|nr:protein of unknown function transrane [Candidatus Saccharibacteria bacterium]